MQRIENEHPKAKRRVRRLYPQQSWVGTTAGVFFDVRFTSWKEIQEHIRKLGPTSAQIKFLEDLFIYPEIRLWRAFGPVELSHKEDLAPEQEKTQLLAQRGISEAPPLVIQKVPGFEREVMGLLKKGVERSHFPLFGNFFDRFGKPLTFNLQLIKRFGDKYLKGELASQILFYTHLQSEMETYEEALQPPNADDLLRTFRPDIPISTIANPYEVRQVALGRLRLLKEKQAQEQVQDRPKHWGGATKPLHFAKGIPWQGSEELLAITTAQLCLIGQFDGEGIFLLDKERADKVNMVFAFVRLAELDLIPQGTSVKKFVSCTQTRELSGEITKMSQESWRSAKSSYSRAKPSTSAMKSMLEFFKQLEEVVQSNKSKLVR